MNLILLFFALKYKGDFMSIYNAIKHKEDVDYDEIERLEEKIASKKLKVITLLDKEYPKNLKIIANPPFVLFYEGNIDLLYENSLCLVGDKMSQATKKYMEQALEQTSNSNVLVTNFFKGFEEEIVNYYLENNKKIIFVSVNGLSTPYFPKDIIVSKNILIISEYPNDVNINKKRLCERNRVTSALSDALIIFSSKKESGIMNLVNNFLEQGKEIYCYPGDHDENDGNNFLIKDGANLITSISDLQIK